MGRRAEPWFWDKKQSWWAWIDGKQKMLAKGLDGKDAAYEKFYKLMAGNEPQTNNMTVRELCDAFTVWSNQEHKPTTREWYQGHIKSLTTFMGKKKAESITESDVSKWLTSRPKLGQSSKRGAITSIKAIWNWGEKNKKIRQNSIKQLKRPVMKRRRPLSSEEISKIFAAVADLAFLDFLKALRLTGARPAEVASVTAAQVVGDTWVLEEHKTDGTGETRVIFLNAEMQEISARRCKIFPEGPIFRQHRSKRPWNRNAIRCRFRQLRKRLGLAAGAVCYGLRHAFCNDALERGVPIATLAQLMGHKDVKMIQNVYSHLHEKTQYLRDAVKQATEASK